MRMKRIASGLLALVLHLSSIPMTVLAAEEAPVVLAEEMMEPAIPTEPVPEMEEVLQVEEVLTVTDEAAMSTSGTIGTELTWVLNTATNTLTIKGTGTLPHEEFLPQDLSDEVYTTVKHIVVGQGITALGRGVRGFFGWFDSLETVTLPDTLTTLGDNTFWGSSSLKSINIPAGITSIGECTFRGCKNMTQIDLPETVTSIGVCAFYECTALKSISLEHVTSLEKSSFYGCTALESITLPSGLVALGETAFGYCSGLMRVEIENGLTALPQYFFTNCTSLETVILPTSLTSLGDSVFRTCTGLVNITLPKNLTQIGDSAFLDCTSLKRIVIPGQVSEIGQSAFSGCTSLESLTLSDSLVSIGYYAFEDCTSLKTLNIPEGINTGRYTFKGCSNLQSVTTASTVWNNAFQDCTSLEEVTLLPGAEGIAEAAFGNCKKLKTINLSEGLRWLSSNAFNNCTALETITFPSTLENIGSSCFSGCTALHTLTFTGDSPNLGYESLSGLTAVAYYPEGNDTWNDGIWQSCGGNITPEAYEVEIPVVDPPVLTASNRASDGAIVLSWTKVESAVKYEVYRSRRENADFLRIASPTANTLTDEKPTPGDPYYYKVKAILENGTETEFSDVLSCTRKPGKPGNLKVTADGSTGKPTLRWDAVGGAEKYQIWRSKTGKAGSFGLINTVKTLTTTNKNAVLGTKYYYKVRAVYSDGSTSNYSNAVSITCVLPAPKGLKATNDAATGKNVISWNAVEGATKYQVWHSTTGKAGSFKLLMTTKNLSHIHKASVAGKTHYYKVKAVHTNTAANSALTGWVRNVCDLAQPTGVKIAAGANGKNKITWNKVEGAAKYQVWFSKTGKTGSFTLLATKNASTLTHTHAKGLAGQTYYYKIKAIHTNTSANSAWSAVVNRISK